MNHESDEGNRVRQKGESGQALVEYAFILLLVVIVVIAMIRGIGMSTCNMYSTANSAITSASNH